MTNRFARGRAVIYTKEHAKEMQLEDILPLVLVATPVVETMQALMTQYSKETVVWYTNHKGSLEEEMYPDEGNMIARLAGEGLVLGCRIGTVESYEDTQEVWVELALPPVAWSLITSGQQPV